MDDNLIDPKEWEMFKSMADPASMVELLELYLSDSPELMAQMRAGLAGGEADLVRRAAHSLKSNSASFGATRLTSASRELEMLAKSGSLEGAALKLAAVEAEYAQLIPVLEKLKNELLSTSSQ